MSGSSGLEGLEGILGKLVSEDLIKSMADTIKDVGDVKGADSDWCYVNGDKPVSKWIVFKIHDVANIPHYKKKWVKVLKLLPEGTGVVFMARDCDVEFVNVNYDGD